MPHLRSAAAAPDALAAVTGWPRAEGRAVARSSPHALTWLLAPQEQQRSGRPARSANSRAQRPHTLRDWLGKNSQMEMRVIMFNLFSKF